MYIYLLAFSVIPFQVENKEFHFSLALALAREEAVILLKHFMDSAVSPNLPNHPYLTLFQAATIDSYRPRTVYAVVCRIIKVMA